MKAPRASAIIAVSGVLGLMVLGWTPLGCSKSEDRSLLDSGPAPATASAPASTPPPPARAAPATLRADIGGYEMRYLLQGSGAPAVIFESALGNGLESWAMVQPRVAAFTRCLAYDRLGLGRSDPGPEPRTGRQIAEELHLLLARLKIEPPYVLVGHSLGAFHIRLFAQLFPAEVAGLVFVQGSHEDLQDRRRTMMGEVAWKAYLDGVDSFFEGQAAGTRAEWAAYDETRRQVRAAGAIPDVPLVVVTGMRVTDQSRARGFDETLAQLHYELQHEWVAGVSNGRHLVTRKAGTNAPVEDPDTVVEAVRTVVDAARTR